MLIYDETTGEWVEDWDDEIPEAPHIPTIKGYGTRVVMDKEPSQWITAGGAEAPPEYVQDIDETIKAVDTGRISEADLSRRIARQEGLSSWSGLRVPPKPPEGELKRFDQIMNFLQSADEDFRQDANDYAEEVAGRTRKSIFGSYADEVLLTPGQKAQLNAQVESVRQQAFNRRFDQLRGDAKEFAEKQLLIEQKQAERAAKIPTDTEMVISSLTQKLGRSPTAQEVLDAKEASAIRISGAKALAGESSKLEAQRKLVTDADVDNYAKYVMTAGEFPVEFNRLFRMPALQEETIKRVRGRLNEWGFDGAERALQSAMYKAGKSSLQFQEKQLGSARSFALNLEGQIGKVEEMGRDIIKRVGVRALDLPIRELKTRFVGSGHERALESYLMEISREIGKLSTGSQASVAELSVDAQKKWDKIHDPNLSLKELKEILKTTNEQASIRINSMESALKTQIEKMGERRATPPTAGGISQRDLETTARKHGISVEEVKRRLRAKGIL